MFDNHSEDLSHEMKSLGRIKDLLVSIRTDNKKAIHNTNEQISGIHNKESPFLRPVYDRLWRGTILKEIYIDKIRVHLNNIRSLVDELGAENEEADSLKLKFRDELNKNQFKFGLAGLARNATNVHIANYPSAAVGLGDFEISVLNEEPPYSIKSGGNSLFRRKKTKQRQTRRKYK
jgi:hypothetical protein